MKNYKLYCNITLLLFLTLTLSGNLWANTTDSEQAKILKKLKNYPYLLAYANNKHKDDKKLISQAIKKMVAF
jgi:hypothetical protein